MHPMVSYCDYPISMDQWLAINDCKQMAASFDDEPHSSSVTYNDPKRFKSCKKITGADGGRWQNNFLIEGAIFNLHAGINSVVFKMTKFLLTRLYMSLAFAHKILKTGPYKSAKPCRMAGEDGSRTQYCWLGEYSIWGKIWNFVQILPNVLSYILIKEAPTHQVIISGYSGKTTC